LGYLRHCFNEISQNREFALMKEVMLKWLQHHNLSRLEANMVRFYRFKTLKQVVIAWKVRQGLNSNKRRNRMQIRRVLKRRPQLASPLFVIRNIRLYQAFQLLKIGVRESVRAVQLKTSSSFALYLRLLRKAFDGLHGNMVNRQ
jgi:hypothetical protein